MESSVLGEVGGDNYSQCEAEDEAVLPDDASSPQLQD